MASVSTVREPIERVSEVSGIMRSVIEKLDDDEQESVSPWSRQIEEYAESLLRKLAPSHFKRKKREVVVAAAVYDAFLEFESRSNVRTSLQLLHEILGRSECSINSAWKNLFDNRCSLRGNLLEMPYSERDSSLSETVTNVVQNIRKAVDNLDADTRKWLEEIEIEAKELSMSLPQSITENFDTLTIAITLAYAAMKLHHGKMKIRITQRNLSLLASLSPSIISKCWLAISESRM